VRIVVEFTPTARRELLQLLSGRARDGGDAASFAALFVEDIEAQFRENEGAPPESSRLPEPRGDEWWWHYAAEVWVGFMVADRPGGWFRSAVRTVRVFAFRVRPPAP
jgi:hypothetical protein